MRIMRQNGWVPLAISSLSSLSCRAAQVAALPFREQVVGGRTLVGRDLIGVIAGSVEL